MIKILILIILSSLASAWATDIDVDSVPRKDGSNIIYYHHVMEDNYNTLLVIIQGGACIAVPKQRERMKLFEDLDYKADVLWVEKYGLTNEGYDSTCPMAYIENNSPLQRASDYVTVFEHLSGKYQKIIVLGAREGAAVLSLLVADEKVPINAAIAINSGGGSYPNDMLWQIETIDHSTADETDHPVISRFLQQAKSGDLPKDVSFHDHGYRWWYEMLNTNMYQTLKNSEKPLLLIQGLADRQLLIENQEDAYYKLIHRKNVTVYYYEQLNHELANSFDQPDVPNVVKDVQAWLKMIDKD